MRPRLVTAFAAYVLSSCAQREETGDSIKLPIPAPKGGTATVRETFVLPLDIVSSLEAPGEVRSGEPVSFVIRLRNNGARSVDLYLRGREIAFDVVLTDSAGTEVWTRLHDQVIPAVLRVEQLGPGKTLELRHVWNQQDNSGRQVSSGDYMVRGLVLTDDVPIRTPDRRIRFLP